MTRPQPSPLASGSLQTLWPLCHPPVLHCLASPGALHYIALQTFGKQLMYSETNQMNWGAHATKAVKIPVKYPNMSAEQAQKCFRAISGIAKAGLRKA